MEAVIAALIGVIGMLVSGGFVWLRSEIIPRLDRMDERFNRTDERFNRIDERFNQMDERFNQADERFNRVDERFNQMDERFDHTDALLRSQGERIARVESREETVASG